jgi:hypothetical protein
MNVFTNDTFLHTHSVLFFREYMSLKGIKPNASFPRLLLVVGLIGVGAAVSILAQI